MLRLAAVVGVIAILLKFSEIPYYLLVFLGTLLYLITGGWRWLKLLSKTLKRDLFLIKMMTIMIYEIVKAKFTNTTLRDVFSKCVKKHPDKLAFVMADTNKSLTFKESEQLCHKIANVFYEAGYRRGDVVALLMENRIEYMPIWLGLSMIGVITSLINYNLRGDSLKHCIDICNCKSIIFSEEMIGSIKEIENDLKVEAYCFDECEGDLKSCKFIQPLMESVSYLPPPRSPDINFSDTLLYIYTSGTTGFPKAAIWRADKNLLYAISFPLFFGCREDDILYEALPLYHGNGMLVANSIFLNGCTTVIKKKFSASQYMEDCCKYNVTVINYIGETCRYILSRPKSIFDERNNIRLALGNGLRASIWTEFKERFNIGLIVEVYASTEGNTVLFPNSEGRVGAVGFRALILPNRDLKLLKMDKETGEILRGADGLALEAEIGEPGQAVGKITKIRKFDGYTNKDATKKKITYDIFAKGDSAYLSGDMLWKDEEGYYYFHDRTGDTFRWKGENVSTNEVEGLISKVIQLTDVCVYGVDVPGTEGKAGMACVCDPHKKTNIDELPNALDQLLPKYAQPIFLRLTSSVDVTGTFKFQKNKLREDGFIPHACAEEDMLYYLNIKEKKYLPLDSEVYQQILNQTIRF